MLRDEFFTLDRIDSRLAHVEGHFHCDLDTTPIKCQGPCSHLFLWIWMMFMFVILFRILQCFVMFVPYDGPFCSLEIFGWPFFYYGIDREFGIVDTLVSLGYNKNLMSLLDISIMYIFKIFWYINFFNLQKIYTKIYQATTIQYFLIIEAISNSSS